MECVFEGFARRETAAAEGRLWLAWHGASFQRAKKLPPLSQLRRRMKLTSRR